MVRKQHLEDSPKSTFAHQLCTWWCSKCVSTILEVMENAILQCRLKRGVSVGTPQTSYSSCDVMYIEQTVWNKPCFQWWLQCQKKEYQDHCPSKISTLETLVWMFLNEPKSLENISMWGAREKCAWGMYVQVGVIWISNQFSSSTETLRTSDHPSPVKMHVLCVDVPSGGFLDFSCSKWYTLNTSIWIFLMF